MESGDFSGINDDEMLAAVLEMSRQEAGLSAPPPLEDEPTSSPDTGFGDSDINDLTYHTDQLEGDTKQSAGIPSNMGCLCIHYLKRICFFHCQMFGNQMFS